MIKFGCPHKFIATVQAHVQNEGEFSEPFEVTNGIQQGCVMAPTLFSMMFSTMLKDAFQDSDTGFPIRKRFHGNILILRMLQAKNMAQTDVQDELFYADDMQRQTCKEPWRGCSTWKTTQCINHHCEQKLKVVDKFTYLESTLSRVVHIYDAVTARIEQSQCGIRQTPPRKCLGVKWNHAWHHAESLQGFGTAKPLECM